MFLLFFEENYELILSQPLLLEEFLFVSAYKISVFRCRGIIIPLSPKPTKWPNVLKQFVGYCLGIV